MAEAKRRLAAILAADVTEYSRLMADDEQATLDALNACRAICKTHISGHHGCVVDTAGDSVLAEFEIVVAALHCARQIQDEISAGDAESPEDIVLYRHIRWVKS